MHDHPIILKALEHYVRRPLAGSAIDVWVFSPAKTLYLDTVKNVQSNRKTQLAKTH